MRRRTRYITGVFLCACLLALAAGCGNFDPSATGPSSADESVLDVLDANNVDADGGHDMESFKPSDSESEAKSDESGEPEFSPEDLNEQVSQAQTAFALKLFQALHASEADKSGENIIFSPISIASALAMTANGAGGETLTEILDAMQAGSIDLQTLNKGYQVQLDLLNHSGETSKVSIANALWARDGLSFEPAFLQANQTFYNAQVTALDFNDERAAELINNWVSNQTEGKINKIIEGPIDESTILFLMNAIYFNANWQNPFEEDQTEDLPFYLNDGTEKMVPTMKNFGQFSYLDGDGFEALRLPYKDSHLSMLVFLPDAGTELESFIQNVSPKTWDKWLSSFERASGRLEMPKFTVEYETGLKDVLAALGMEKAFQPSQAEFSHMISHSENVYIQDAIHKAYIEVEEKGTVAAAVTSITAGVTSLPAKTFDLKLNRPFLYAIHDSRTDTILFMGTIAAP